MKLSVFERVMSILQFHTQKEAAVIVGVSERTIRRWKNEGVKPTLQHFDSLKLESIKIRQKARRQGAPNVAIPPRVIKRKDSLYLQVSKEKQKEQFNILKALRQQQGLVRFVIKVPKGGSSPGGREYGKVGYFSSPWYDLTARTDSDLFEVLESFGRHNMIHEIVTVGRSGGSVFKSAKGAFKKSKGIKR